LTALPGLIVQRVDVGRSRQRASHEGRGVSRCSEGQLHDSWGLIFDLDTIPDKACYALQAALWEIPAAWITSIEPITAR
jgi:hypothetical protein